MKRSAFDEDDENEEDEDSVRNKNVSKLYKKKMKQLYEDDSEEKDYMNFPVDDNTEDECKPSLDKSLFTTNKDSIGLKMMQNMGFKPGESLGKNNSGQTEPICVEKRLDKSGVGAIRVNPYKDDKQAFDRYLAKNSENYKLQKLEALYKDLQKVGSNLYESRGAPRDKECKMSRLLALWASGDESVDKAQLERDSQDILAVLTELIDYLRDNYGYCYFCGCDIDDNDCPGPYEADHKG